MKAAIFKGAGQKLAIETRPDPEPGPNDVVIKIGRCGICGTDFHMTSGHGWDFPAGAILGHEFAGEVVARGKDATTFKTGDLITAPPSIGCGACEHCHRGMPLFCANVQGGLGGLAEYRRVPVAAAVRLPKTLSLADGALIEPLAVGLRAAWMAQIRPGAKIAVIGAGSVGLAAIYWSRKLGGGRVVATSRSPARAKMAIDMGADAYVESGEGDVQRIADALGGAPEIVFECVGASGMVQRAIQLSGKYGHVLSLGFCISPDPIEPAVAAFKQVRISFPLAYSMREFEYTADTLAAGGVDPKMMITSVIGLNDLPDRFEQLRAANTETKVHVAIASA